MIGRFSHCLSLGLLIVLITLALGCASEITPTSITIVSSSTAEESNTTTTLFHDTTTSAPPTTSVPTSTTMTSTTAATVPYSMSIATPSGPITLSPRQLAGQRVIYSYAGLTPPEALFSLIQRGEAAGVIFFADNISTRAQIRAVIQSLNEANDSPENPVRAPLLLMTDQEGGMVRRLPGAPLVSQKQIGLSADPLEGVTEAGTNAAQNLADVGMNVNLAPVLDVYRQAGGFADKAQRSYSTSPEVVANLGSVFIRSQQDGGVAATAKHFPGLGAASASQNTDARPVTLNIAAETLRSIDELPYEAAIETGVRLVMLSWATYPELDAERPAGFSAKMIQGELRDRLSFRGVTITDSLGAGSLQAFGSPRNRALLAAQAGMDLMLCANLEVTQGEQALDSLRDHYLDGTLSRADFKTAVQRVVDLRLNLDLAHK